MDHFLAFVRMGCPVQAECACGATFEGKTQVDVRKAQEDHEDSLSIYLTPSPRSGSL